MATLPHDPTVEQLADANILDLRDWLAERFDDESRQALAPLGYPLVEVGPDYDRACAFVVDVKGTGRIRVALTVEVDQEQE